MFVMLLVSVRGTSYKVKSLLDGGGNRTLDLWFASNALPTNKRYRHIEGITRLSSEISLT
jgi:hypothetical protein